MARAIFFLIDGLADPGKNTPLKLAKKPNLNKVLNKSFLAELKIFTKKDWPKYGDASLTGLANLKILGYEIKEIKRGPLEAIGADLELKNGELALRVDFATIDKNLKVIDRRAGRNVWGLSEITKTVNEILFDIPFHFHRTYGHRGVLIFKQKLSPFISNSDPLEKNKKIKKIKPLKKDYLTIKTAKLVQKFLDQTHYVLDNHPINLEREKRKILKANYLLTREAGNSLPRLENFFKKYKFKNGLVVAENGVVKGGCKLVGFDTLTLPEIENINKRYEFYQKAIFKNFNKYDLIYLHLKEADEASHDKNFQKKKKFFEFFDNWFSKIYRKFSQTKYIITGDHITNTKTGKHQFGNVPILIINHQSNNPKDFNEIEARRKKIKLTPQQLWRDII
ncbi:MAG: phosphoglycerate mutase [Candidatus Parcubacteria bacterium]|nr:MAG: phosphoglycerate mutase [Candidatus Parcubacteria bacterium]